MVATPSEAFLTKKVGVLPVWGWGAVGLGAAYGYSRWQSNKASASNSQQQATDTGAAGESTDTVPQFIIENNEPGWSSVSQQVTVNPTPPVPVTTPPGTGTNPPTNNPPPEGGNPPHQGNPVPVPPPTKQPTPTPAPPAKPAPKQPIAYKVQHGDTLSSIAAKYHTTWQTLWAYNTGTGSGTANRPASTIATLKQRGPNLLYAGETIYVPQ